MDIRRPVRSMQFQNRHTRVDRFLQPLQRRSSTIRQIKLRIRQRSTTRQTKLRIRQRSTTRQIIPTNVRCRSLRTTLHA